VAPPLLEGARAAEGAADLAAIHISGITEIRAEVGETTVCVRPYGQTIQVGAESVQAARIQEGVGLRLR
jgi:hypothetical protein